MSGWYPGHMARARRLIKENLRLVDVVLEVVDARIPFSGRNPELGRLIGAKPRVIVLNKADLADPGATRAWLKYYASAGEEACEVESVTGRGCRGLGVLCEEKSRRSVPSRLMIVGVPNSGKSSLLNRLVRKRSARVGAIPGITRGKQWVRASAKLEILDLPGVLSPRKGGHALTMRLGAVGVLHERSYDPEEVVSYLFGKGISKGIAESYRVSGEDPREVIERVGERLGCLGPGGKVDREKAAMMVIRDFQKGKLGRYTLDEIPE